MAKGKNTGAAKTGLGLGALAVTAAGVAAGYYFYASKDAKKNRRIAAKWAVDMKDEVVEQAKKAKNINKAQLVKIIDNAAGAYETVRSVDRRDLANAARELKMNWREIADELRGAVSSAQASAKKGVKSAKKTAKFAARKVVKKRL